MDFSRVLPLITRNICTDRTLRAEEDALYQLSYRCGEPHRQYHRHTIILVHRFRMGDSRFSDPLVLPHTLPCSPSIEVSLFLRFSSFYDIIES